MDATNSRGATALFAAIECGHSAVIRILIDAGADVKKKDKGGLTTLTCMCDPDNCNVEALSMLLAAGAPVDVPSGGHS